MLLHRKCAPSNGGRQVASISAVVKRYDDIERPGASEVAGDEL